MHGMETEDPRKLIKETSQLICIEWRLETRETWEKKPVNQCAWNGDWIPEKHEKRDQSNNVHGMETGDPRNTRKETSQSICMEWKLKTRETRERRPVNQYAWNGDWRPEKHEKGDQSINMHGMDTEDPRNTRKETSQSVSKERRLHVLGVRNSD